MANYYVRSGAGGTADGSTWANAYTTLAAALTARSAGDTFWLADDHAETQASAITLTSPGTANSLCKILCVNTHTVEPPTALATSATISTTGANAITTGGYAYVYGVTITAGDSSANASINLRGTWRLEACKIALGGNNVSGRIVTGTSSAAQLIEFINTTVSFANSSQGLAVAFGLFSWKNTASAVLGTAPATLFLTSSNSNVVAYISGVDLSAIGSGKNLVLGSANATLNKYYFRNCKLGASVTVISAAITGDSNVQVDMDNCDSGNTNTRMENYRYQGSTRQETTKVKSSGASDGTTPISWKMTSLSTGPTFHSPLGSPWMLIWGDTTGSSKTATVEILHDSLTALTDAEVWLEVEYLGTSSFPESVFSSDRTADDFATPANQTSSSVTWTTTGLTNPNKQKLEVTFTPQSKGPIRARVLLAKTNYTIYVDPVAAVA